MIFFCEGNVPSSKNGRRWTGKYFVPSKATITWRKETKCWWDEYKEEFLKGVKDKVKPYKIGIHFVRNSRHKYDWINPVQTIQDEMVKQGWIDDDNITQMMPFPFVMNGSYSTYNKEKPGFYIKVM